MSEVFTPSEIEYLKSQPLARLATIGPKGAPQIAPVGVIYDPETQSIVVAGHAGSNMVGSRKFLNARERPDVAYEVDDVATVDPWAPRAIEIRGHAETFDEGAEELGKRLGVDWPFDPAYIRIRPRRILTRGIDTDPFELSARNITE